MIRRNRRNERLTSFRDEPLDLYEEDLDDEDYDEYFENKIDNREFISESRIKDPAFPDDNELVKSLNRSYDDLINNRLYTLSEVKQSILDMLESEKQKRGLA